MGGKTTGDGLDRVRGPLCGSRSGLDHALGEGRTASWVVEVLLSPIFTPHL